jgi:hypothetical protein
VFKPGETVYAVGPGLGEFIRYEGRRSAVVKVRGTEYVVPVDAISPTTTYQEAQK